MASLSFTAAATILVVTFLTTTPHSVLGSVDSHGLGDHYNWVTLDDGYELARTNSKPLMLIIHKSWCGACKALKPKFKDSAEILELSSKFVMVNVMDEDEPSGDQYTPDGGYIPRILFFDPEGELLRDVVNVGGNPSYKYYYSSDGPIADSMRRVLELFEPKENGDGDKKNSTKKVEL